MQVFAFCLNTTDDILSADYKGTVNSVLDFIERVWQIIAAAVLIAADIIGIMWYNGGREAVIKVHRFWDDEFIPSVENAIATAYSAGVRSRMLWERINSPLFIAL